MSVIEASTVGVKTMADGTLRLTTDIEPQYAQAAFALFGAPGRSVALAALKDGHGAASDAVAEPDKPKGGELARVAGIWCNESDFLAFIRPVYDKVMGGNGSGWGDIGIEDVGGTSQYCAHCIKVLCDITSRIELDHKPEAAEKFQRLIRLPYMAWLKTGL